MEALKMCLLALTDPTDLAGASGWFGAGLLGLVLAWLLFKGYPAGLQAMRDIAAQHALTEKDQRMTHSALEAQQRAEYQAAIEKVLEHCRVELREIASRIHKMPPTS